MFFFPTNRHLLITATSIGGRCRANSRCSGVVTNLIYENSTILRMRALIGWKVGHFFRTELSYPDYITNYICSSGELALAALLQITVCAAFLQRKNYCARSRAWIWMLSGCLPKILIAQIGHKIDFLQILCVNYTLSGYFKNAFRLGSKCFLLQFTRGVPWWTKMDTLLVQKCQFSMTLVTPHNN